MKRKRFSVVEIFFVHVEIPQRRKPDVSKTLRRLTMKKNVHHGFHDDSFIIQSLPVIRRTPFGGHVRVKRLDVSGVTSF